LQPPAKHASKYQSDPACVWRVISWVVIFTCALLVALCGGLNGILVWLVGVSVVLGLFIPFIVVALALFLLQQRVPARPTLRTFNPAEEVLPVELAQSLEEIEGEIDESRFRLIGHYELEQNQPRFQSYLSVFDREESHDRLWLMNTFPRSRLRVAYRHALVFITEFKDGQIIETSNRKPLDPFPGPANHRTVWLPRVRDAAALYRLHCRIIDHLHVGHSRIALEPDPAEHFRRSFETEFHHLVNLNYAYRDDEDRYRFTWKGAIILTCRQFFAPPRARREAARLLARLRDSRC
jgi:hypothetical protein